MPFAATWIELEIIILSEVRQRQTNTIWYHLYVKSLDKFRLTDTEHRFMAAKGEWQGREGVGVWD